MEISAECISCLIDKGVRQLAGYHDPQKRECIREILKMMSELEPEAMVAELRAQGMAGIYLDLDGYTEEEQQPTLQALINAAGCDESDVIISEGGTLCYIPLGKG